MAWFDDMGGGGGNSPLDLTGGLTSGTVPGGANQSSLGSNPDFANLTGSGGGNDSLLPAGGSTSSGAFGTGLTGKELTAFGGAAVAGGALGYNLLKGDKVDPNITSLQQLVQGLGPEQAALFQQGNQYMSYLANGTLPPGLDQELHLDKKAAQARFLQNAASSGLSADPNKNSALAQDLNSLDSQESAHRAQMATQLLSAGNTMISNGISISNLDANVFKYLSDYDLKQSQATGSAISSFAAALGTVGGAFLGGPAGAAAGGAAGKAVGTALA